MFLFKQIVQIIVGGVDTIAYIASTLQNIFISHEY